MKNLIILSAVVCLAVVVRVNNGQVEFSSIIIKQNSGSLHVRPAGVAIRPQ